MLDFGLFVLCFLFFEFVFVFWDEWKCWTLFYVVQFQYGNPDILCLPLVAAHTPGQDLVVLTISPHSCYFPFLSGFVSPVLNPMGVLKTLGSLIWDTWHFVRTPTSIEIIFYFVYLIKSIFSTTYQKEDEKTKLHVTRVIEYMWFIFEFRSFVQAQIFLWLEYCIRLMDEF